MAASAVSYPGPPRRRLVGCCAHRQEGSGPGSTQLLHPAGRLLALHSWQPQLQILQGASVGSKELGEGSCVHHAGSPQQDPQPASNQPSTTCETHLLLHRRVPARNSVRHAYPGACALTHGMQHSELRSPSAGAQTPAPPLTVGPCPSSLHSETLSCLICVMGIIIVAPNAKHAKTCSCWHAMKTSTWASCYLFCDSVARLSVCV